MKKFILFLLLIQSNIIFAQNDCNCDEAMQNLIFKIEKVYPGFKEKTKDTIIYNSLKRQLIYESKKADDSECLKILKKYTSFFKDGHIWILPNKQKTSTENGKDDTRNNFKINITDFKKDLQKSTDKLEGIWKSEKYMVGIKRTDKHQYTGFIIETNNPKWKPRQIKFHLNSNGNATYYASNHSPYEVTFEVYKNFLLHFNIFKANFIKQGVHKTIDSTEIQNKINELDGFYFKKLTDKTSLLRISSFNYPYIERIEKLIEKNRNIIENSENLIIDIRNNGGGTDNAYKVILPFISTNPIRHIGTELLSSHGLINGVINYRDGLIEKDSVKYKDKIKELNNKIKIYKNHLGEYVNIDGKIVETDTIEIAKKSPEQIVILANEKVGSAAENFLLKAKQSKKVKILGRPTSGVLDYANAYFFKFGCNNYKLLLPTYRSQRLPEYPIDNIGIQPDVYLDKTVEDWIKFAIKYLEYK